jgi:hypothetical protein
MGTIRWRRSCVALGCWTTSCATTKATTSKGMTAREAKEIDYGALHQKLIEQQATLSRGHAAFMKDLGAACHTGLARVVNSMKKRGCGPAERSSKNLDHLLDSLDLDCAHHLHN